MRQAHSQHTPNGDPDTLQRDKQISDSHLTPPEALLIRALSEVYEHVPEPPQRLEPGRARVMAAASRAAASHPTQQQKARARIGLGWRLAAALLAFALLIAPLTRQISLAANSSVPGEILYPLKITYENLHLSRITQPEARVALALAFLSERIAEMQMLVGAGRPIPIETLAQVEELSTAALESAAWTSNSVMTEMLQYIAMQSQIHIQTLETLKAGADEANQRMLERALAACLQKYVLAHVALAQPETFREAYQTGRPEQLPLPGAGVLGGEIDPNYLEELRTSESGTAPHQE